MSKRTWFCVRCRKSYLRKKSLAAVECSNCHGPCEDGEKVRLRVPSPTRTKEWDRFWVEHKAYEAAQQEVERLRQELFPTEVEPEDSLAEFHRPYVEGICIPLIETLTHSASLPVSQLAGHVANVDFWLGEARHCLAVIDGYQERFSRLRAGQENYEKKDNIARPGGAIQRSTKHRQRQELRQEVCVAVERFLARCHREGLLAQADLKAALDTFGK